MVNAMCDAEQDVYDRAESEIHADERTRDLPRTMSRLLPRRAII